MLLFVICLLRINRVCAVREIKRVKGTLDLFFKQFLERFSSIVQPDMQLVSHTGQSDIT